MRLRLLIPALLATSLAAPALARADVTQPESHPLDRQGLFGGLGAFGGNISCDGDNCGGFRKAGGLAGHVGYGFTPRLAGFLDGWFMTSTENDVTITYVVGTVGVRFWVAPILWIEGGVGNGHANVSVKILGTNVNGNSDDVPTGFLAAGLEVVRGKRWALDVQGRVAQGTATDDSGNNISTGRSAGLGVAITWF